MWNFIESRLKTALWNLVPTNHLRIHLPRCHIFHTSLYSESLSRTYRLATSDPTWSRERSLCSDAMGRAAPSPSDPGCFSSLSLDQLSSLPDFPFMFTVRVGADCCVYDLLYCCEGHIRLILCMWRSRFHSCAFLQACQHVDVRHTAQSRSAPLMPSHFHAFLSRRVAGSRTFLTNAATMRMSPLDPRSPYSSAECTTCHYTRTWGNIQYRAPL